MTETYPQPGMYQITEAVEELVKILDSGKIIIGEVEIEMLRTMKAALEMYELRKKHNLPSILELNNKFTEEMEAINSEHRKILHVEKYKK